MWLLCLLKPKSENVRHPEEGAAIDGGWGKGHKGVLPVSANRTLGTWTEEVLESAGQPEGRGRWGWADKELLRSPSPFRYSSPVPKLE